MLTKTDSLKIHYVTIEEVIKEADEVKTFLFADDRCSKADAGQFVMIWLPSIAEKPMSLSIIGKQSAITVKKVGSFTSRLHELGVGDKIGVRGPYGSGFRITGDSILLVAGGIGLVPLMALAEKAKTEDIDFKLIYGVKNAEDIIFKSRLDKLDALIVSEDGNLDKCGMAVDFVKEELDKNQYDMIATCGPELMLRSMISLSTTINIPIYVSLERYIKCGIGLCGACGVDPLGKMVCSDGPVFNAEELVDSEIGNYRRDKSGVKQDIK